MRQRAQLRVGDVDDAVLGHRLGWNTLFSRRECVGGTGDRKHNALSFRLRVQNTTSVLRAGCMIVVDAVRVMTFDRNTLSLPAVLAHVQLRLSQNGPDLRRTQRLDVLEQKLGVPRHTGNMNPHAVDAALQAALGVVDSRVAALSMRKSTHSYVTLPSSLREVYYAVAARVDHNAAVSTSQQAIGRVVRVLSTDVARLRNGNGRRFRRCSINLVQRLFRRDIHVHVEQSVQFGGTQIHAAFCLRAASDSDLLNAVLLLLD